MMLFVSHCNTRHRKYALKCFHIFLLTPNFLKTPKNDRKNGIVIFDNVLTFNPLSIHFQIQISGKKGKTFSQNESQKDDCINQLDSKEYSATFAFERLKNAKSEVVCVFFYSRVRAYTLIMDYPNIILAKLILSD